VGLRKLLHTTTFRLAAVYVAGFAASVAALGVITYVVTASALERRLDARMASEMNALQSGDLPRLIATVHAHQALHPNGAFEYALVERGKRLAGDLTEWPSVPGWQDRPYNETNGDVGRRRFLVAGRFHGNSIPPSLIRPEVIAELKRSADSLLAPAISRIVAQVERPLLQAIFDLESPRMIFGRVALLGDAAFVARPHAVAGVTKAALDARCLADSLNRSDVRLKEALALGSAVGLAASS